ncbi:MAG: hypothetical protein SFW09_18390 [Hyphomicrobiaceae bacterium]|nr:hypothetical protein [Hyphomicrobiaceae bacterium]
MWSSALRVARTTEVKPRTPANAALMRLLSRMPSEVVASFTATQLSALASGFGQERAPHLVDFLVSLPLLGRRYYLRVYLGRERRSYERLLREGQISLARTVLVWSGLAWMLVSLLVLGSLVTLYLVKSYFGINLMSGRSPLHFIYELIYR